MSVSLETLIQLLVNIGALVGVYTSIKVAIAKLEVHVSRLNKDVANLGDLYRTIKKTNTSTEGEDP